MSIGRGSATFTAAVYQQVTVTAGSNLRAAASAFIENVSESNAGVRIGIDPNGGTNPLAGGIVWSGFSRTVQAWNTVSVDATAASSTITVFLYTTQQWPNDPNNIYWDDASLVVGGGGGSAPADTGGSAPPPTAAPLIAVAPFVSAQGAQPDGSIVHTVGSGDTVDSIAVAYGVRRQDILTLNNLSPSSFLQIGQRLLIKPADQPASSPTEESPVESSSDSPPDTDTDSGVAVAAPTTEPRPTDPPPPPVTPTLVPTAPVVAASTTLTDPSSTKTAVCVTLFEDSNANRIQETSEKLLAGGQITLNSGGQPVDTQETDGIAETHCFEDIAPGDYIVSARVPQGYGLTTPNQLRLRVQQGTQLNVNFGAAVGIIEAAPPPVDAGNVAAETISEETAPENRSLASRLGEISGLIVFGLAGVALIGGIGLTLVMRRR